VPVNPERSRLVVPSGFSGNARSNVAAKRGRSVTVLASGDPLWYGAGVTVARHFPRK
jgi:precorrin-6B methylase 1